MPTLLKEGDQMEDCKHVFIGRADGVHCTRCGLKLSPAEYADLVNPVETLPETKPKRSRKKVSENE